MFHTVSLTCSSIWVGFFQNVIALGGVHLLQVELSECEVWSQSSCGQAEQDEQSQPVSSWAGLGWAARFALFGSSLERPLTG